MGAADMRQETYLPEGDEAELADVYDFLALAEGSGRGPISARYVLSGASVGEQVELPPEVYRVLRQVVEAMSKGLAVTVAPQAQTLTTQQAADLLGISRPTLIRLLEGGRIAFERVGTHRRVLLRDVLAYREVQYAKSSTVRSKLLRRTSTRKTTSRTRWPSSRTRRHVAARSRAR